MNGRLTINSSCIPGNIDNVDIDTIPVQIRTYGIDMTNAPDSTASTINLNGAQVNGDPKYGGQRGP